jgi:hypothetical protein
MLQRIPLEMNRFDCRGVDGGVYRIENTRVTEFPRNNGRLLQAQISIRRYIASSTGAGGPS